MGTTIFTVMSRLAAEQGAINLSQGFPDFDPPPALLERVAHHLNHGCNQYAPMEGVMALRERIAEKVQRHYGRVASPEHEITVTAGATEALFCAITALVRSGDEVIVFDPAYDAYEPAVRLCGGITRHLALREPHYRPDWNEVAAAVTRRTRLIIVNSPHNPTGGAWTADDLDQLSGIVDRHGLYVLSDEVYEHIIFDGRRHESLLRRPELYARSLVVSSFGKTCHATGWKIGYCVAPPELTTELRRVHQYVTFTANSFVQHGLADFMAQAPEHATSLGPFYQRKRDRFCELLEGSRFRFAPAAGTYFQLLDYGAISSERDVDLARRLTVERGVTAIPVSVFYARPPEARVLRFCFAKDDATLAAAAEILCRL